jgi:hypothetical protein
LFGLLTRYEQPSRYHIQFALTPPYLLALSGHYENNVLEAFPLPNDVPESAQPNTDERLVLARSHAVSHPYHVVEITQLSSRIRTRSRSKKDHHSRPDLSGGSLPLETIWRTFLVGVKINENGYNDWEYYPSFLDVVLEPPINGKGSMTVDCAPGRQVNPFFFGECTVQGGRARIITCPATFTDGTDIHYACTVDEGKRTIEGSELTLVSGARVFREISGELLTGRLCKLEETESRIHIYEFV